MHIETIVNAFMMAWYILNVFRRDYGPGIMV